MVYELNGKYLWLLVKNWRINSLENKIKDTTYQTKK